jgi:hypothetical protein
MRITQTLLKADMGSRLQKTALVVLAIACGVATGPTATFADTVSLSPQKDNTLYEDSAGQLSNGQGIYLYGRKDSQPLAPWANRFRSHRQYDHYGRDSFNVPVDTACADRNDQYLLEQGVA